MEQHPVPQHIASFEFKLFGNLTMRQFVTLAIPMSVATIIFFSNIPVFVRLPLSGIIGIFGLFIALIPVSGRPFEKWLIAFVKAIFSPTQRIWIKEEKIPEFLNVVARATIPKSEVPEVITGQSREKLLAYIRALPREKLSSLDVKEQTAVGRLGLTPLPQSLIGGKLPAPIIWPTTEDMELPYNYRASLPQVEVVLEGVQEGAESLSFDNRDRIVAAAPEGGRQVKISSHAKPYALSGLEKKLAPKKFSLKAQLASDTNFALENVIAIRTPDKNIKLVHSVGKTRVRKLHFAPPEGFDLSKLPIRGERKFEISEELKKRYQFEDTLFSQSQPQTANNQIQSSGQTAGGLPNRKQLVPKPQATLGVAEDVSFKPQQKEMIDSKIQITSQKPVEGSLSSTNLSKAQMVPLTNKPNVLSGLVSDKNGTPIFGAILTVRDASGIPMRALKTNKLGQFLSATPLPAGQYLIEIESESSHFQPVNINLKGEILVPMELRGES